MENSKNGSILSSNFIPMEPEEITADWLFEVINQYRLTKEMSPVKQADDLISCEIAEKKSSKGRLSSTYVIDIKFKCYTSMGNEVCTMNFFLKLLPSAAITNGDKNRAVARKLRVFCKEVKSTFQKLPQVAKWAGKQDLNLAIPEIVYGSHDNKGNGVIVTISEEKKGFLSPRQYSGLTLPEVTVVIDRISEIHAVTTAMFISKSTASENTNENLNWLLEEENDNNVTQEESNAYREDVDLVFRTLAHFLRRVPGYLDKHSLICKIRPALVDNACQTLPRSQLPLKCLTHGELYERNVLFNHVRRSRSCGLVKNVVSDDFARDEDEMEDESEADAKALSNVDISALLTDWKHSSVSSPSSDLAFFFLSSTSQAMREKYTQDWLEQYYFSFTECLRSKFGIKLANVYPEFDFDVFCKDFKKHVYRAYLQAVQALTRELRFVENEFHYVKGDEERERAGQSLKFVGRRLLELVDELIEIINAKDWRRDNSFYLGLNKDESVSMTIKLAASTK